jgi:hypothetical protein
VADWQRCEACDGIQPADREVCDVCGQRLRPRPAAGAPAAGPAEGSLLKGSLTGTARRAAPTPPAAPRTAAPRPAGGSGLKGALAGDTREAPRAAERPAAPPPRVPRPKATPVDPGSAAPAVSDDRPPDAWAVWSGWEGTRSQFTDVIDAISRRLSDARVAVEAELATGRIDLPDGTPTKQQLNSFRWLRLLAQSDALRVEVEFARTRRRKPTQRGKGVILRVWALNPGAEATATASRTEIAAVIDEGRAVLAGEPRVGSAADDDEENSLRSSAEQRDLRIRGLALAAVALPVFLAPFLHGAFKRGSTVGDIVTFCACHPMLWIGLVGVAVFVALFVTPRVLPAVGIGPAPRWKRLGKPLASLGVLQYLGSLFVNGLAGG